MELKKTGIAPIVECPTKTVGGKQCRSIFTIHRKSVDFNIVNKNLSEMPLGESVTAAGFEIVFKSNRFFF